MNLNNIFHQGFDRPFVKQALQQGQSLGTLGFRFRQFHGHATAFAPCFERLRGHEHEHKGGSGIPQGLLIPRATVGMAQDLLRHAAGGIGIEMGRGRGAVASERLRHLGV